ncbi:unnamed protein product [Cyclocybe aegerita]|uniref:Uncharacterized protein n=1 Tax=Cyclocybe aegerita TaxID=1973307 RepID=A0A8S0WTT1_CYCAE|nr:unnamed protein product [Cyclocybe aegerita]
MAFLHLLVTSLSNDLALASPSPRDTIDHIPDIRSLSSIIYSCIFTVAGCLWISVRPNIPSPNHSRLRILRSKLNIMFWVLASPDFVVFWAFRQWLEASILAKKYRDRGWTRTHGQFVIIGGFMLYSEGRPLQTLSVQKFNALLSEGAIEFPSITESEIRARGQQSPILTTIVGLQALWFVIQCSARFSSHLYVTHLELLTLALVVITALLYVVWWDRPLDVGHAVRVDLKYDYPGLAELGEERTERYDFIREKRIRGQARKLLAPEPPAVKRSRSYLSMAFSLLFRVFIGWPFLSIIEDVGALVFSVDSASIPEGSLHPPLFYCPETSVIPYHVLLPITSLLGCAFNGVNIILFSSTFPSSGAELAWKIGTLVTTGFSGLSVAIYIALLFNQIILVRFSARFLEIWSNVLLTLTLIVLCCGFLAFLPARITLIVDAFVCLGSLPETAFDVVSWTTYIPHFS